MYQGCPRSPGAPVIICVPLTLPRSLHHIPKHLRCQCFVVHSRSLAPAHDNICRPAPAVCLTTLSRFCCKVISSMRFGTCYISDCLGCSPPLRSACSMCVRLECAAQLASRLCRQASISCSGSIQACQSADDKLASNVTAASGPVKQDQDLVSAASSRAAMLHKCQLPCMIKPSEITCVAGH